MGSHNYINLFHPLSMMLEAYTYSHPAMRYSNRRFHTWVWFHG